MTLNELSTVPDLSTLTTSKTPAKLRRQLLRRILSKSQHRSENLVNPLENLLMI